MTYHILNTDGLHHKYGPKTPAGYTGLALADQNVRDLLQAVTDAGIRDRTTIFIVADHGFNAARKLVLPNVAFRKAGLITLAPTTAVLRARAQIVSEGGIAMVYLLDPATRDADREKVVELMKDHDGIGGVLTPDQFAEHHLPTPRSRSRPRTWCWWPPRGSRSTTRRPATTRWSRRTPRSGRSATTGT
jgi:arylsulfatase A-like enzyme